MSEKETQETQETQESQQEECTYRKTQKIEINTKSLENEIEISKTIESKLKESKYYANFSHIIKSDLINVSQIKEDELSECNLSSETNESKYILCTYNNRPKIITKITDYLFKKSNELDIKIFIKIALDCYITLRESLQELYKITNIVHHSINNDNIIVSEEQIPIIRNFKEAKIKTDPNEKIEKSKEIASTKDIHALTKLFIDILTNIKDDTGTVERYKQILTKDLKKETKEREEVQKLFQ